MNNFQATPTESQTPLRPGKFSTLVDALDYAAKGKSGFNFYTSRGQLQTVLPYAELQRQAQSLAFRLLSLKLERGSRVALIAETHPEFPRFFFACQYAGLTPVPLPASLHLGGHQAYVTQLRGLLADSQATVAMATDDFLPFLLEASEGLSLQFVGNPEAYDKFPEQDHELNPLQSGETAYLQYTSGSTRFPRGVMVTEKAVMNNLAGIIMHGLKVQPGDRCFSWLPFYHDMGLVGFVLAPMASQLSVDYLATRDFAMRPLQWLALMTKNRNTISFGPPFGYELCARRLRPENATEFDLSAWRIAGVGAETIRAETLEHFAELLAPSGFDPRAFLASYGMAECSLAVSFAQLDTGIVADRVDAEHLAEHHQARTVDLNTECESHKVRYLVNCGVPLPEHEMEVRGEQGQSLPDRTCGTIFVRGPSVMSGYFGNPEATAEVLANDGWLNTGDIGYLDQGTLVIAGREKDLIIINGRNIWPQDLEYIAEQQPEVRPGDACSISVTGENGEERAIMVVQCRLSEQPKRSELVTRLSKLVREELGIDCFIELVSTRTLPRTSSGKLSRAGTRRDFLERQKEKPSMENHLPPESPGTVAFCDHGSPYRSNRFHWQCPDSAAVS